VKISTSPVRLVLEKVFSGEHPSSAERRAEGAEPDGDGESAEGDDRLAALHWPLIIPTGHPNTLPLVY
jgi:hypothetical protein